MTPSSPLTFCISTYNNLPYLQLAIDSVRKNSYFKDAPFIVHAENCTDGTNEWLDEVKNLYNLEVYIENNEIAKGIGGGMNFCANKVQTEYIIIIDASNIRSGKTSRNCQNSGFQELGYENPSALSGHQL